MMEAVNSVPVIEDIKGEPGTNAGGMLEKFVRLCQILQTSIQKISKFRIYLL